MCSVICPMESESSDRWRGGGRATLKYEAEEVGSHNEQDCGVAGLVVL